MEAHVDRRKQAIAAATLENMLVRLDSMPRHYRPPQVQRIMIATEAAKIVADMAEPIDSTLH